VRQRAFLADSSQQRVFSQQSGFFERTAQSDSHDDRRARIGTRCANRVQDKLADTLDAGRGTEQSHSRHVFAAKALWGDSDFEGIAFNQVVVDDRGRIVSGIAAKQGIRHDGSPQIALSIAKGDPRVDGVSQTAAANLDILAQGDKNDRHAGVLTDGQSLVPGYGGIFKQLVENSPTCWRGLTLASLLQSLDEILAQIYVGGLAKLGDCLCDGLAIDRSQGILSNR
jgi:hypothetical protein